MYASRVTLNELIERLRVLRQDAPEQGETPVKLMASLEEKAIIVDIHQATLADLPTRGDGPAVYLVDEKIWKQSRAPVRRRTRRR